MKRRYLQAKHAVARRLRSVWAFFRGPSDPILSDLEQRRLRPLEVSNLKEFDVFQETLAKAGDDDESECALSNYLNDTYTVRTKIFNLETRPWIRAAAELNVTVGDLFDRADPPEPDDRAFGRLKRDITKIRGVRVVARACE